MIPETQLLQQGVRPRVPVELGADQIEDPVSSTTYTGQDGVQTDEFYGDTINNVGEVETRVLLSGLETYDWDETVKDWDSCFSTKLAN